ncbi:MAG: cell division protein SepF [Lachnospiraceae bacterium]
MSNFQNWLTTRMMLDDEYDDDVQDEAAEEEEDRIVKRREERRDEKKSFFSRSDKKNSAERETEENDEGEEDNSSWTLVKTTKKTSKGVKIEKMNKESDSEVRIIEPEVYDDAEQISIALNDGVSVVLNLEKLDLDLAMRISDFAIGACSALNAHMQKISTRIFVITPLQVKLSGVDVRKFATADFSALELDM